MGTALGRFINHRPAPWRSGLGRDSAPACRSDLGAGVRAAPEPGEASKLGPRVPVCCLVSRSVCLGGRVSLCRPLAAPSPHRFPFTPRDWGSVHSPGVPAPTASSGLLGSGPLAAVTRPPPWRLIAASLPAQNVLKIFHLSFTSEEHGVGRSAGSSFSEPNGLL